MVTVKISMALSGSIFAIEAIGHSGYRAHGEDIVCSAVSTLMQALATGLIEVIQLDSVKESVDERNVSMSYSWQPDQYGHAEILARTIYLSLKGVALAYPKHVVIIEEEYNERAHI